MDSTSFINGVVFQHVNHLYKWMNSWMNEELIKQENVFDSEALSE